MKKRSLLLGILILGCSMTVLACGKNKTEVPSVQEMEDTQENLSEISQSETDEEHHTAQMKMPEIVIDKESRDWKDEDGIWWIHAEYENAALEGGLYTDAAETLKSWCEEQEEGIEAQAEEFLEYDGLATSIEDYAFSISQDLDVKRADTQVISVVSRNRSYTGGAHGNYGYTGITIDSKTGKKLEFKNFIKQDSIDDFYAMLISYLSEKLSVEYGEELYVDYQDTLEKIPEGYVATWYFDAAGIGFIFDPYLLGPYAMGAPEVVVPYSMVEKYIDEDVVDVLEIGNGRFSQNMDMHIKLGEEDDESSRLCLKTETENEYSDLQVTLECGDSKLEIGNFARVTENYFLKTTDGRSFVILCMDYASDDFVTFLYEVTNGVLKECEEIGDLELDRVVSADKLYFRKRLDVLGTYMARTSYYIDEKGKLVQSEDIFQIDPEIYSWNLLTTVKELPILVDEEEVLLPVGSKIRIEATDNQGLVYIQVEDTGVQGTISYVRGNGEEDSWIIYIDGVSEYEYFEQLPYAG